MRKRMKRTLGLMMAAMTLCSCAVNNGTSVNKESDLPELKIGSAIFSPYFYVGEDGEYTGADVEIAKEACRRLGYTPNFTELTWGDHDRYLEEGTVDCLWCSFSMNGREEEYQWAGPYLDSPEYVVVSADGDIYSMEDLEGKKIAVQNNSTAETYFLGATEMNAPEVENVLTYTHLEEAFVAFGKGYADAVASHVEALGVLTEKEPELYRYIDPPFLTAKLGVAFYKDNSSGIVEQLSDVLDEMKEDGTITSIAEKYGIVQKSTEEEETGD